MDMTTRLRCGALSIFAALLAGCAVDAAHERDETLQEGASDDELASTNKWSAKTIRVCWMNQPTNHATARTQVRDAIREIEQKSRLRFTGWVACTTADNPAIRIEDSAAGDSYVGPKSTTAATMHLDLEALGPNPSWLRQSALHEFSHAVGLRHEHQRLGSPCRVDGETTPPTDSIAYGPFDDRSITNYCAMSGADGTPGVTHLSPWDVYHFEKMYGGAPGYFYMHDGVVYRLYNGTQCRVVSNDQLMAFGGWSLITTPESHGGTPPVASACAWPDGFYRVGERGTVWVSIGGTVCGLESASHMDAYGGAWQVKVLPLGAEPTAGLTHIGTCGWPGGFYKLPDDARVFRILGSSYCAVKDSVQLWRFGGSAGVRTLPYRPSGLFTGRTFGGGCPG
jgi:hypothetical protein